MQISSGQVRLVTELLAKIPNIIIVSVRTPYDVSVLPAVPTVLAAYGNNPPSLQAIADVLTGKVNHLVSCQSRCHDHIYSLTPSYIARCIRIWNAASHKDYSPQ